MQRVYCIECGEPFWRDYGENWKKLCIVCWKYNKSRSQNSYSFDSGELYRLRSRVKDLEAEVRDYEYLMRDYSELKRKAELARTLQAKARDILFLIHPDKHDGNQKAHELASWINSEVRT